ncbi:response regulator transcription factor [Treponema sp. TIM-1]|uniref:response regulator transcription factor n=1 Tax=Treponema sp. TIM-1 TaxID=2898417 RepID=UPI00398109E9
MYKVFLVEDEIVVREGIRNSIPWDKAPYTLAGEAPDGEMALSIIMDLKPDILITDIKMPFMDGLTLCRIVKKTLPWIKIIILSGHDEFEYARKAISIGVEEYLLKPVSSQDMIAALDKIAARIDEEKEKLLSIEHLKKQVQSHADILRERWLLDFVHGRIPPGETIEQARELGLDLIARSYIAAVVGIVLPPDSAGKSPPLLSVKAIIKSITEKYSNVLLFPADEKKYVMLIRENPPLPSGAEAAGAKKTEESMEESLYSIALGLARIADERSLAGEGNFDPTGLLNIETDPLVARLKYASGKDVDSIIKGYADLLGEKSGENQMLEYYIFGDIIVGASKIIEELGGDIKQIIPFSLQQNEIREIINSREMFYEKIRALCYAVIEFRESRTEGRYQSVILKTKDYIERNYGDQDISLHTVASHVGISPNHLSTVFSQETGENFIEYLTKVRIERAKHLLSTTGMKNADIAFETGFSDPHYFSFIFKKHTGLSPREWKKKENKAVSKLHF